ncbi:MAG: DUF167 family protein [Nitrosomonas sp.]|uniref:DUF167 domain-containing protein n=1 Tax=unclassified Nitrosomonas TaxID=2609265 RepID=UPI001A58E3C6|nr:MULTISPECIES: DUF167 family protein [unclassified Nitrosomonas]MBL8500781.1 YggU family protein [Nitrosomonas sp.]MCG7757130.1 DUF167 family protein [Nitrosomonas sp.]MDV6341846.1 DUF167 family protein [Nitrosomonas sp. Is24]UJP00650.1 MAG: DUF167 family protein [Nitrosomonas sp.]UJP02098.1 MAG: DUF167 family protein [Nitrosomonas sp.]
MGWYRYDDADNLVLTLHIQPGAKNTAAAGLHGDALKIKLAAPPVEGKANTALLKFLAERFDVPLSRVILKQGDKSRHKVIVIQQSAHDPAVLLDGSCG